MWYVYVLRCAKNSYYVGVTRDLKSRFYEHCRGSGALFTKRKTPEAILYHESFCSKSLALKREQQLKRWSRAKKEALMAGDTVTLRSLSTSHD